MARIERPAGKHQRPTAESELIMAGARLKFKAAKVLSTTRAAAEAAEAEQAARDDLGAEIRAQAGYLTPEQRAEIAAYLASDSEVSAA